MKIMQYRDLFFVIYSWQNARIYCSFDLHIVTFTFHLSDELKVTVSISNTPALLRVCAWILFLDSLSFAFVLLCLNFKMSLFYYTFIVYAYFGGKG